MALMGIYGELEWIARLPKPPRFLINSDPSVVVLCFQPSSFLWQSRSPLMINRVWSPLHRVYLVIVSRRLVSMVYHLWELCFYLVPPLWELCCSLAMPNDGFVLGNVSKGGGVLEKTFKYRFLCFLFLLFLLFLFLPLLFSFSLSLPLFLFPFLMVFLP